MTVDGIDGQHAMRRFWPHHRRHSPRGEKLIATGRTMRGGVTMPYRLAHYYVLFVLAVIGLGFWPSYFSAIDHPPGNFMRTVSPPV